MKLSTLAGLSLAADCEVSTVITPELLQCLEGVDHHLPGSEGYTYHLNYWSSSIPTAPGVIVVPETPAQISQSVKCAGAHDVKVSVRSGGHGMENAGYGFAGHMNISMEKFRDITVNDDATVATAGAAVRNGNILYALGQIWDSGVPRYAVMGNCMSVALGGLLTGGGYGMWPQYTGFGVDKVRSMRMILADGRDVKVTNDNNFRDLFWAVLGGGGSFGIVYEFELDMMTVTDDAKWCVEKRTRTREELEADGLTFSDVVHKMKDYLSDPTTPIEFNTILGFNAAGMNIDIYSALPNGCTEMRDTVKDYPIGETTGQWAMDSFEGNPIAVHRSVSALAYDWAWDHAPDYTDVRLRDIDQNLADPTTEKKFSLFYDDVDTFIDKCIPILDELKDHQFTDGSYRFTMSWLGTEKSRTSPEFANLHPNQNVPAIEGQNHSLNGINAWTHRNVATTAIYYVTSATDDGEAPRNMDDLNVVREAYLKCKNLVGKGVYQNYSDLMLENWGEDYYGDNFPQLQKIKAVYDYQNTFSWPQSIPLPVSQE